MGSELMEETKCRLALEAEVQELRMRLASAEVAATRAPYSGAAPPLPADGAGGFGGLPGGDLQPGAAAAAAFDQAVRASLPDSPPRCDQAGAAASGAGGGGGACWSSGVEQAVRSRMKELPLPRGGASATLASSASYADLMGKPTAGKAPAAAPATAAAAASAGLASAARGPRREGAPLTGSAAALRLSREELDARVQQILGRVQSQPPLPGSPTGAAAP